MSLPGILLGSTRIFDWPDRLTNVASWHAHIPFGYWCVEALRPRVLVELGTHKGDSYCAFCEAVGRLSLSTACYAVDSWKGDHEAGFYDDAVYAELQSYHDPRYGGFSRLIRSTFDEAVAHFPDGSIDLLHIDGLHTHEAVRHDFETWLPKLSRAAVVLFHDINVREKDFGAWRFWQEISPRFPHFSFLHGHGLGVLLAGEEAPEPARRLAAATGGAEEPLVRSCFARLGAGIELAGKKRELLRQLTEIRAASGPRIIELERRAAESQARLARLGAAEARLRRENLQLRATLARRFSPRVVAALKRSWRVLSRLDTREARLIAASGLFDAAWYLKRYPDVAAAGTDPLAHFVRHGAREGRSPSPRFDAAAYLARNPDVAASGANPLVHQLRRSRAARSAPPAVALPEQAEPVASIVIPVHGQSALTRQCLLSIAASATRLPYEVIVVDDASPDDTASLLAGVPNLRVVTNESNLGYLRSCNAGAAVARGRYLVLLNNDTEVSPGWLDALAGTAEADPSVGVVGAKLVYPGGTLQEAGGIIWSDGSGWNYGRGGDPEHYQFNFVREVDYCSGACLLVRTDLFRRLGGYDERFAPAYYEDTDLCFAARASGFRVLYQPGAVIVHHEGASHGTDIGASVKRHQETNRHLFRDKWAADLASHARPGAEAVERARDRRRGPGVLVVDHRVPTPDRDSGSLRMSLILKTLTDLGCRVRLLPADLARLEPYTSQLGQLGVEVIYQPAAVDAVLRGLASDVALAILSRPAVAVRYLPLLRETIPGAVVAYDMVDCHWVREMRRSETCDRAAAKEAAASRELELALVQAADITIAVTGHERDLVLREVPGARVHVVPNIHASPRSAAPFAQREGLLFVGSFLHPPNEDAVTHFHAQIFPLVRARLPEVVLHLVGAPVPESLQALASPSVRVHGWVEDLAELHERCRVFVSPLRYGAGMKGKIGDSMVRGLPVVTTSVGAEGMHLTAGENVLVADDPRAFADAVVELYTNEALWRRLSDAGARFVEEHYGVAAATRRVAALLETVGLAGQGGAGRPDPGEPQRPAPGG